VSKRGLPAGVQMRHDFHYVDELNRTNRPIGKIIPIDKIEPNPEQPRTEIGDLTELAATGRRYDDGRFPGPGRPECNLSGTPVVF